MSSNISKTFLQKRPLRILAVALFWIALWQTISIIVGEEILFPSPIAVCKALFALGLTPLFWQCIGSTFFRILLGILVSSLLGIVSGILAGLCRPFREIFGPAVTVIKAAPIASFIVLLVLWLKRGEIPGVIAGLIVLPVFYSNLSEGIMAADPGLLEMADAFGMNLKSKLRFIYLPSLRPYLISACASSFGMAWKAGVAAEVIVLPMTSIGRQLYYAGNNLDTCQAFAWTAAVILLSLLFDYTVSSLLHTGRKAGHK